MGSIEGVASTRSAWIDKHEVVLVAFRPEIVNYGALLKTAKEQGCASRVWATTDEQLSLAKDALGDKAERLTGAPRIAKTSDQLYYIRNSPLKYVPLTALQAQRVNGALYKKQDAGQWLSPRQQTLRERVDALLRKSPNALDEMERPQAAGELAAYTAELQAVLTEHESPPQKPQKPQK